MATLPSDPSDLLDHIYSEVDRDISDFPWMPSRESGALTWIGNLIATGTVPADVRASLYQAAALIPGIEIVDSSANLSGKTGVAFGIYDSKTGVREDLIIDPSTGALLGERQVLLEHVSGLAAYYFDEAGQVMTLAVDETPDPSWTPILFDNTSIVPLGATIGWTAVKMTIVDAVPDFSGAGHEVIGGD